MATEPQEEAAPDAGAVAAMDGVTFTTKALVDAAQAHAAVHTLREQANRTLGHTFKRWREAYGPGAEMGRLLKQQSALLASVGRNTALMGSGLGFAMKQAEESIASMRAQLAPAGEAAKQLSRLMRRDSEIGQALQQRNALFASLQQNSAVGSVASLSTIKNAALSIGALHSQLNMAGQAMKHFDQLVGAARLAQVEAFQASPSLLSSVRQACEVAYEIAQAVEAQQALVANDDVAQDESDGRAPAPQVDFAAAANDAALSLWMRRPNVPDPGFWELFNTLMGVLSLLFAWYAFVDSNKTADRLSLEIAAGTRSTQVTLEHVRAVEASLVELLIQGRRAGVLLQPCMLAGEREVPLKAAPRGIALATAVPPAQLVGVLEHRGKWVLVRFVEEKNSEAVEGWALKKHFLKVRGCRAAF